MKTGVLQIDIFIGNLTMNKDESDPSWSAVFIDLDLAPKSKLKGAFRSKRQDQKEGLYGYRPTFGRRPYRCA
jgi:hypothetical protein